MRPISSGMAAALAGGATTLAHCWKVVRRDGVVAGFTDHDRDLALNGDVYRAQSGATGSQMEADFSFAVSGGEIAGALSSSSLETADLIKGLWDNARIEIYLVNWENPTEFVLLDSGNLGEIRRQDQQFTAELRSLAHRLDEERGRLFTAHCAANFGDARCGMNAVDPAWSCQGVVAGVGDPRSFFATASGHAEGLFTGGTLVWLGGANSGAQQTIAQHALRNGIMHIVTWAPSAFSCETGDPFRLVAGCDKQFATCRDRFANATNFRGFPHMPGNDYVISVAREGTPALDGGSLFQ